jgi:hypothetical protein
MHMVAIYTVWYGNGLAQYTGAFEANDIELFPSN